MDREFKEIRERYADVVCSVSDHQMFRDIRALLGTIDRLHGQLVEQAAAEALQAAFLSLDDGAQFRVH